MFDIPGGSVKKGVIGMLLVKGEPKLLVKALGAIVRNFHIFYDYLLFLGHDQ
jgi:hypothetical protein|tara:strand:- start:1731 stop:1886 length:156 start_codon:yes stop_codon:yes gene_type:complete